MNKIKTKTKQHCLQGALNRAGAVVESVGFSFYFIYILFIHSSRNLTACIITLASHHHFIITLALHQHHHCHFLPSLYKYKSRLALYCRLSIH